MDLEACKPVLLLYNYLEACKSVFKGSVLVLIINVSLNENDTFS